MDALWDNHRSLNKQELDLVVFGERKGGEDDRSQAQWQTIQDGLAQEKWTTNPSPTFAVANRQLRQGCKEGSPGQRHSKRLRRLGPPAG